MDSMMGSILGQVLRSLLGQVPMLLVCVVGLFLLIGRYRSLGPAGMPAVLGLGLLTLLALVSPVIWAVVPQMLMDGAGLMNPTVLFFVFSLVQTVAFAAGVGCLVWAVLAGRAPAS